MMKGAHVDGQGRFGRLGRFDRRRGLTQVHQSLCQHIEGPLHRRRAGRVTAGLDRQKPREGFLISYSLLVVFLCFLVVFFGL